MCPPIAYDWKQNECTAIDQKLVKHLRVMMLGQASDDEATKAMTDLARHIRVCSRGAADNTQNRW